MRKQVHNMYEDGSLVQSIKKGGWKKQAKKVIASVMVAAMVITGSAVVSPQNTKVAEAADPLEIVGAEDMSTLWWGAHSQGYAVEEGKILNIEFDNFGSNNAIWNNYVLVFTDVSAPIVDGDGHKEYAIVRADNYGWGPNLNQSSNGTDIIYTSTWADEVIFKEIMANAHVSLAVERVGAVVKVYAHIVSNVDAEKFYDRTVTIGIDEGEEVFLAFTTDESCMKIMSTSTENMEKHNVTVNYVMPEDATEEAPATKQVEVYKGYDYSIVSPELVGYRPDKAEVEGTMGTEDVAETVTYEFANAHRVTLNYVMPEGVTAPEPVSKMVSEGVEYSIPVPEVEGCKPDKTVVTGTMGEEDIEVTVTYSKSLNYTISGQWNALGAGYQVKVKKNFDIDFKFHNAGGNNNWENYGVALDMNATVGTWASGWFLRADRWSNLTITEPTYALVDCSWGSWDDGDSWWTTFRDVMKDANVVVNVKRVSDIITITNNITGANGETLSWTAVANNCPTERMAITLCCESPAKATIDSVTDNSAEGNGFLTEDDLKDDTSSSNNNNTFVPVITPSPAPTASPSAEPSESPSVEPTVAPSTEPTTEPTVAPTTEPTVAPTVEPTTEPTDEPSNEPSVNKGDKVTSSKVTYTVTNVKSKTVSYQKDKKISTKKTVSVPATVKVNGETYKVTTVAKNAFANAKKLTSVTVGKNITKIGDTAFKGCGKLTTITIKSTKLTSVGKNVLKGTSKKLVIKVPASKVAAYKKLFKGKGNNSVVIKKA